MCKGHRLVKTKEKNRTQFQIIPPVMFRNIYIHLGPSGFPELELVVSNCLLDICKHLESHTHYLPSKTCSFYYVPSIPV